MAAAKRARRPASSGKAGAEGAGRTLERRLAKLEEKLAAERVRHARQLASLRREGDRRLAGLMREIALLRHHEARAEVLARQVAERDTALAAQADRVAQLKSLLQPPVNR